MLLCKIANDFYRHICMKLVQIFRNNNQIHDWVLYDTLNTIFFSKFFFPSMSFILI